MKKALITGITGQDGSYLAELLLERPTEVHALSGDSSKARRKLNWSPETTFRQLVRIMLDHDLKAVRQPAIEPVPVALSTRSIVPS